MLMNEQRIGLTPLWWSGWVWFLPKKHNPLNFSWQFIWWHGNASTRKRLNTETDQKLFLRHFRFFLEIRGNNSKVQNCWGISEYFVSVSQYLELNGFLFFLINFLIFLGPFPHIFDPFPLFSKTLKIIFCWSLSSNCRPLSHIFDPFPPFSKTFKISICWLVSSNFKSVSSYFLSVSVFSKTLKITFCWIGFPKFLVRFPYF